MEKIETQQLLALVLKQSTTFYAAFKDLPEKKRNAVFTIYGFSRFVDDLVDVNHDEDQLEAIETQLLHFCNGVIPNTFLWISLKEVFDQYPLNVDPFFEMFAGQRMDLHFIPFETIGHLEQYCYFVAGTVGMMLLPILATKNYKKLELAAIDLGIAMQITNILRDVGEDADMGRCYLPAELLIDHDLDFDDILEKRMSDRFILVWEELAKLAENRYDRFEKNLDLFDEDSKGPLMNAVRNYRKILDTVRESGYDCMETKSVVKEKDLV